VEDAKQTQGFSPQIGDIRDDRYSFGPYQLDPNRPHILKNGRLHSWRSKTRYLILKMLIDAEPAAVSFDEFFARLWPGKACEPHLVGEHVRQLKLCIAGCSDHIKNHPGLGYSFDRAPKTPQFAPETGIDSYAAMLHAIAHAEWTRRTRDSVMRALTLFRELADLRPTDAKARLGIAECSFLLCHVGFGVLPIRSTLPKARSAARRALLLARRQHDAGIEAAALSVSGLINMTFNRNFPLAEEQFASAISLTPHYVPAHHWRAHLFLYTMRWKEALDEIALASKLALNAPMVHGTSGWFLYFMNRPEDAIRINSETVRLYPEFPPGYFMLGIAYESMGQYDDAINAFQQSIDLDPRPTPLAALCHTYAVSGKRAKAQGVLRRLQSLAETEIVSSYFPALAHTGLRNFDEALRLLNHARKEGCDWLIQLNVDPRWKPLHGIREFTRLTGYLKLSPPLE